MRVLAALALLAVAAGSARAQYATSNGVVQGLPVPCPAAPVPDTLLGSVGSAGCYVPRDASRPTAVQAANVTTDASGVWSVVWARPFVSAAPVVNPLPVNTGQLPILCNVAARSGSTASGQCWQSTATTLPAAIATAAGLVLSPFGTPASNAAVMVIAREPTQ